MNNEWFEDVKVKNAMFNARKNEIENVIKSLVSGLINPPHNLRAAYTIINEQDLIWNVEIGSQRLIISESEIAKEAIIEDTNDYGDVIDTGEKICLKEVIENIILKKLKSF